MEDFVFHMDGAEYRMGDGCKPTDLASCRVLVIGAHQDDIPILAIKEIAAAQRDLAPSFVGVTVTNGGGSARKGIFENHTDEEMQAVRRGEQWQEAKEGRYLAQIQLNYPSARIKADGDSVGGLVAELRDIIKRTRPDTLITHQPLDKHETHVAVMAAVIEAVRGISKELQPKTVLGVEVWRGLDWAPNEIKVGIELTAADCDLQKRLIALHRSQVEGGRNYAEGIVARELGNATFSDSHAVQEAYAVAYGVNLRPFLENPSLTISVFNNQILNAFSKGVTDLSVRYKGHKGHNL